MTDKRTKAGVALAQTNDFGRLDEGALSAEPPHFRFTNKTHKTSNITQNIL